MHRCFALSVALLLSISTAAVLPATASAQPPIRPSTPRAITVATGTAALPVVASAQAPGRPSTPRATTAATSGTLVFIRGGDVWIARPNGSGARQVTTNGTTRSPYRTPTQDDHGRVFALRGHGVKAVVYRMSQNGRVLKRYGVPTRSFGPAFVSVSPSGAKLAYETMFASTDCSFTPCHTFFDHALEYAHANTGKDLKGARSVPDVGFASWAGNSRTILQTPGADRVLLHRPAEKHAVEWFTSCKSYQNGCGDTDVLNYYPATSRQGTRFATSRLEYDTNTGMSTPFLLILATTNATTGNPPPPPGAGCAYPGAVTTPNHYPAKDDLTISAPSFSPNGHTVAFAERSGRSWTTKVYTPVIDDCGTTGPVSVLKNAAEPHWSAAHLSAPHLRWNKAKPPRLKGKAKVGKTLHVVPKKTAMRSAFTPKATRVTYQWLRNGKKIKHASHATYQIRKADSHKRLKVRITGNRRGHVKKAVTSHAVWIG